MNRLLITIAGVVLGLVLSFGSGFYGGEHIEHEKALVKRQRLQEASMKTLQDAVAKNAALEQQYNTQARKSADEYEAKISGLDAQYRAAGTSRMRIVAACRPVDGGAAAAKGPGQSDAAAGAAFPAEVAVDLPAVTQQQLLDLAHDADEQRTRLQALQEWIHGAGLY